MSKPQWHLSRIGAHPASEAMPEGMGRHEGEACWLTQSAPACATRPWPLYIGVLARAGYRDHVNLS